MVTLEDGGRGVGNIEFNGIYLCRTHRTASAYVRNLIAVEIIADVTDNTSAIFADKHSFI